CAAIPGGVCRGRDPACARRPRGGSMTRDCRARGSCPSSRRWSPSCGPPVNGGTPHWCDFDRIDLRPQETPPEPGEEQGVASGAETVPGGGVASCRQTAVVQDPVDVLGRLVGAGDERDALARDVGDGAGEQRVVGAAEDERVAPGGPDGLQVPAYDL